MDAADGSAESAGRRCGPSDPRRRAGRGALARHRPRHRTAARARAAHGRAGSPPRRARRERPRRSSRDTYYVALLHASGCTSNGHEATQLFGEDIEHRAAFFLIDPADPDAGASPSTATHVGPGRPPEVRERMIEAVLSNPARARESFAAMCEVAQRFAGLARARPGHRGGARVRLRPLGRQGPAERRRRRGAPAAGASPPRGAGLLALPLRRGPRRRARRPRAAGRRGLRPAAGRARLRATSTTCRAELDETRMWEQALESEPFPAGPSRRRRDRRRLRRLRRAHRPQVAVAARALDARGRARGGGGLAPRPAGGDRGVPAARRARADLGRVGVSNAIWEKPGRSGSASGSASGCTRTSPSARSPSRRRSPRSACSPARTTSGSTGPGYHRGVQRVGARHGARASSPPRTATRRCGRRGRTGRRSSRRRPRRS